jgi:hypothetical protein
MNYPSFVLYGRHWTVSLRRLGRQRMTSPGAISTTFRAAGSQHEVRTISLDTATGQCGWLFGL